MHGKIKDKIEATGLRQADSGTILCKSADVPRERHQFYADLHRLPGHRTQALDDAAFPWEHQDALDTIHLETHVDMGSWTWTGTS